MCGKIAAGFCGNAVQQCCIQLLLSTFPSKLDTYTGSHFTQS